MKHEDYIKEMQELENEAPTLFSIPKKNNFSVPEGYFDQLPTIISEKIAAEPPASFMEQIKGWLLKPQMALAAFVFLIGISAILYLNDAQKITETAELTESIDEDLSLLASTYSEEDMMIESLIAYNDNVNLDVILFSDDEIESYLADTEYYINDNLKAL